MRKVFFFMAAVCCGALLAACGGSSSSSESTTDGILGELDEYVQDFYAKSNEVAALGRLYGSDEATFEEGYKLSPGLIETFNKLMEVKDQAVGREMPTVVREGTPMKVIKPMTVMGVQILPENIKHYEPNEHYEKKLQDLEYAALLSKGILYVKLECEVELTEDIRAQKGKYSGVSIYYDHYITSFGLNSADSIISMSQERSSVRYDEAMKAGTRVKLSISVQDKNHRPYDKAPKEEYYYDNLINQITKFEIVFDANTSAALSDNGVKGELGLFELQGPVKKCTILNDWGNVVRTFDEQGFWQTHDGKKLSEVYPGGIERDEYGRIIKGLVDKEGNGEEYSYNKFGKVLKYNCHIYDSIEEDVYTYDDNGNLLKKHIEMGGMDAEEPYDETYTNVVTDDKGNWTSRKANGEVQKRKIEYYN